MLLDCLGCTVAGAQTTSGRAALAFARYGAEPQARTIDGTRVTVERAAFANTICCNALDHEPVGPEGHVGAVAFSRTGDPATGDFSDAKVIRKFGDVPDDLSAL